MGTYYDAPNDLPIQDYSDMSIDLPENFDSRNQWGDICNFTIYDQGRCGSCWAFGATEAFEDRMCIACEGRAAPKVSVQEIVSCNWLSLGCNGGFPWAAWEYMALLGVTSQECLPYGDSKGSEVSCPYFSLLFGSCPVGSSKSTTQETLRL